MRGLLPPPGGPSLQDARWGLANLARLLGVVWKWTPRTLQAAVGATLSIWAPLWPQKGLAPPVEGWLCWIHHVPGLKDRAVTRWGNEGTNFLLGQVPSGPPPWLFLVFVAITKESWIRVGGLSPMNGSSWCACLLLPLNREFAQGQLQL